MASNGLKDIITPKNPSRETSPNRGTSLPQESAISADRKSIREWQQGRGIDRNAQIRLTRIAHMRYQHPNLEEITTFLRDFGMTVAKKTPTERWFKGYGTDPYVYYARQGEKKFLGGTFEVASFAELEKAATLPTATPIQPLTTSPGGGHAVTLLDPENFPVTLMHGQTPTPGGPWPEILTTNYETTKPRVARFQRFTAGPAAVHKLGHYGLCVGEFPSMLDWYTRTFNLVATDMLYTAASPGNARTDVAAFLHIDLGQAYTDHHSFFLSALPPGSSVPHVHHSSFETHDFDTQHLGHAWLASRGYTPVWGVGRHVLGSQIFDYWWDTSGNMVEHYADGDLVNEDTPVGWGEVGDESLAVWGPDVPGWFLD